MSYELRHKDAVSGRVRENEYEHIRQHILNDQATGDIVYASSAAQLSGLAIGSTGYFLTVTAGKPAWANSFSVSIGFNDDILFTLGTNTDIGMVNRSTILGANTGLAGIAVGTPVAQAVAANSLLIGNVTASGDIALYVNKGGASQQVFWADGSSGDTAIMASSGQSVDAYIAGTKVLDMSATGLDIIPSSAGAFALRIAGTAILTSGEQAIYINTPLETVATNGIWITLGSTVTSGDLTGIRSRVTGNATSAGANVRGAYLEAKVGAGKFAAMLEGALIHADYSAIGAGTISGDVRGLTVQISQGTGLTAANLYGILLNIQTRGNESITSDDVGLMIRNEAVGGNGRAMDSAIKVAELNMGGVDGFVLGMDLSGTAITTADIKLHHGSTFLDTADYLTIKAPTGKYTRFGDATTTQYGLNSEDDALVTGELEARDLFVGAVHYNVKIANDKAGIYFGDRTNSWDAFLVFIAGPGLKCRNAADDADAAFYASVGVFTTGFNLNLTTGGYIQFGNSAAGVHYLQGYETAVGWKNVLTIVSGDADPRCIFSRSFDMADTMAMRTGKTAGDYFTLQAYNTNDSVRLDAIRITNTAVASALAIMEVEADFYLIEKAAAGADIAGRGQLWAKTIQGTVPMYTGDTGLDAAINRTIFTGTASHTNNNTTDEETIIPTGVGTLTIPASTLAVGNTIRITAVGHYGSKTPTPGTLTIRLKLGSVTLVTDTHTLDAGLGNDEYWELNAIITVRSLGAPGTVWAQMMWEHTSDNPVTDEWHGATPPNTATSATTTTGSLVIDITDQFSAADNANTITLTNIMVEILN